MQLSVLCGSCWCRLSVQCGSTIVVWWKCRMFLQFWCGWQCHIGLMIGVNAVLAVLLGLVVHLGHAIWHYHVAMLFNHIVCCLAASLGSVVWLHHWAVWLIVWQCHWPCRLAVLFGCIIGGATCHLVVAFGHVIARVFPQQPKVVARRNVWQWQCYIIGGICSLNVIISGYGWCSCGCEKALVHTIRQFHI